MASSIDFGFGKVPTQDIAGGLQVGGGLLDLVGGFEKAAGYDLEASAYEKGAEAAGTNILYSQEATAIRQYQQIRKAFTQVGAEEAALAGNELSSGGSGLYLLRSSVQQGALASGLIGLQGAVEQAGYRAQQQSDTLLAEQAKSAAGSSVLGGIASGIMGIAKGAMMFGA